MSDLYSELLVKKLPTSKDTAIKGGMIALVALAAVLAILLGQPLLFLVAAAAGIAAYFVIPSLDLEYEYLYVNGELDIDRVIAKTKRKKAKSFDINKMEILAPLQSHRIDYYNNNQRLKQYDFSSGNKEHNIYAMIIPDGQEICKVLLELDGRMLTDIKKTAPRKVFMD